MGKGVEDPKTKLASTFGFFITNNHGEGEVTPFKIHIVYRDKTMADKLMYIING